LDKTHNNVQKDNKYSISHNVSWISCSYKR